MKPRGWVYAITNPSLDGLVKIGFSMKDPNLRASEGFDPAGLPDNFIVGYMAFAEEPRLVEQLCHKILDDHRYKKEWFRVSLKHAADTIAEAIQQRGSTILFESERPSETSTVTCTKAATAQALVQPVQKIVPRARFTKEYFGWNRTNKMWVLKAAGRLINDNWVLQVTERADADKSPREFILSSVEELKDYCKHQGLEVESFAIGVMNPVLGRSLDFHGR